MKLSNLQIQTYQTKVDACLKKHVDSYPSIIMRKWLWPHLSNWLNYIRCQWQRFTFLPLQIDQTHTWKLIAAQHLLYSRNIQKYQKTPNQSLQYLGSHTTIRTCMDLSSSKEIINSHDNSSFNISYYSNITNWRGSGFDEISIFIYAPHLLH